MSTLEKAVSQEHLTFDTVDFQFCSDWLKDEMKGLFAERDIYKEALEKIGDPRKRDHQEPDAYTQLGCVMNIANEALEKIANKKEK